ncbi:uncharacterized protein RCC_05045 [Ramularia collo-cygni]|uniref:C2H2-type domain-containing protein n=1 Tax=Ramularia collo-cygni TaxID=112498 RepID=A0A2D3VC57_9PEZI|nr:uncharacterized protein RCC_05045 [Ramularia collo-cygni]CZT19199.1 uncharacterized protein RCC_05045 [Ramularia collo-cygni]
MDAPQNGPTDDESRSSSPELDLEEHQEYRDISSPVQDPTTAIQAIHEATPDRRYTLLLEIVSTIPAAKALAEERLLLPLASSGESSDVQPNLKRKAYEICENCKEEYSVESNDKGSCVYHDGNKEVNYKSDMWIDHDDDCHGDPDSFADDPNYADGFRWGCCEQNSETEGCVVSRHVPKKVDESKKARTVLTPVSVNINANAADSFRGPGGRSVVS